MALALAGILTDARAGSKDQSAPEIPGAVVMLPEPPAPDEVGPGKPTLVGNTWALEGPFGAFRAQKLDGAQRLAYIEHITGVAVDPFATRIDQPDYYISFVIELENQAAGQISFNPGSTWLVTNREWEIQSPLGLNDLGFLYRVAGKALPPAYERIGDAIIADPVLLSPGESISGLLMFKAVHPKTKWMKLEPVLTLPTGDILRFSMGYQRPKPEKQDKKKRKEDGNDD